MNASVPEKTRGWTGALVALLLCLAWISFWYWDTAVAMVTIWMRSATFAHAFLVPFISLWLIWRQRHALATLTPRGSWSMLILLAPLGVAWLLGELAAINAVTQLALVALLVFSVPALLGVRVARAMMFPLGYLFFAVPIGEFVMPQMMEWTADFTVNALMLTGIPVYREGQNFVIPSGTWSVVEACSGVRYLIASVVVGTLYAYLNYRSLRRRLIFVAVSFAVPIVANWLRAYMIVMLGHLSGNKLAVGVDHVIYGWIFFGVVMLLMFWIGARWSEHPDAVECATGLPPDDGAAASSGRPWVIAIALMIVVALPQAWLAAIERMEASHGSTPIELNLTPAAGWQVAEPRLIDWRPVYINPAAEMQAEFTQGEHRVGIFIAYYRRQDYDEKLVSSDNVLVKSNDRNWARVSGSSRSVMLGSDAQTVRVAELRGQRGQRLLVWHWYWINGRITASDYLAKLYQALYRLMGKGDDSAAIIVYTPEDEAAGGAAALESFVRATAGSIDSSLRHAR